MHFVFYMKQAYPANDHVTKIVRNCEHFINILRSLCGVSWGSDPQNLLRLYTGAFRPKLEYMSPILLDYTVSILKIRTNSIQMPQNCIGFNEFYSKLSVGTIRTFNVHQRKIFFSCKQHCKQNYS